MFNDSVLGRNFERYYKRNKNVKIYKYRKSKTYLIIVNTKDTKKENLRKFEEKSRSKKEESKPEKIRRREQEIDYQLRLSVTKIVKNVLKKRKPNIGFSTKNIKIK